MNRTELFDILLKNRTESKTENGFLDLQSYAEYELNIIDYPLIESIVDEMIDKGWVKPSNYSKFSVCASYEGKKIIEKYGSYSSFLRSENAAQKKAQRSKMTPDVIKIGIAIIFGLSTAILGWLNYTDNKKIEFQRNEIQILNKRIDSLETELKKRQTNKQ